MCGRSADGSIKAVAGPVEVAAADGRYEARNHRERLVRRWAMASMLVEEAMTTDLVTCDIEASLRTAAE